MPQRSAGWSVGRPRAILPASGSEPSQPSVGSSFKSTRRHSVMAACRACRKQKTKCSGDRPSCRRCIQRRVTCQYTTEPGERQSQAFKRSYNTLQDRASVHEELLDLLKRLPARESQSVLDRIRAGTDAATVLNQGTAGDVLLQMAVAPETRLRYELPYISEMPEALVPNNPYLDSLIYEVATIYSDDVRHCRNPMPRPSLASSSAAGADAPSIEYQDLYLKPFHAAQVVEPLLTDANISLWTSVCEDNLLMGDLLNVFFLCEYQFTAAFQKDLFLEDLASHNQDFCSSLLVNVVLAYSCVCYPRFSNRAEYWNPHTMQYRFLAEARRLWELEASVPRITTIQAGILFNVFYNLSGLDEVGQAYRIHAIALATELRLLERNGTLCDNRQRRGLAFTAWALYNWETLVGFSFLFPPLLIRPPDWPLPNPLEDTQFYGEIWLKYPLSHSLSSSFLGHVLKARSEFRMIMNEYCQFAFAEHSKVTPTKAYKCLSQLRTWYENLERPLLPRNIVLPGHIQLHLYYHHLILTIFEPLVGVTTNGTPAPKQVVVDAHKHIQTLIRLYYLRHGFEAMDIFIVIPLMVAGYESLNAIKEEAHGPTLEALRSTLILVAKGLYCQRQNHHLAVALFRVIRSRMREAELGLLKSSMKLDEEDLEDKYDLEKTIRSHWPVSVVRSKEEIETLVLTNLVKDYASMSVEGKAEATPPMDELQ